MKKILAALLTGAFLAAPVLAADVMVWKLDEPQGDLSLEEDRAGTIKKGEIYDCYPDDTVTFPYHVSDNRTFVRVQPMTVEECEGYFEAWIKNIDYTVTDHKPNPNDRYDIEVFALIPGVSQYGGITRDQVEAYLNRWNATVTDIAANSVTFRFFLAQLASSEGFFGGHNVAAVVFDEIIIVG